MAACVLVEKRFVEQRVQFAYRRVVRHKRDLAEASRAVVRFDYAFEHVLIGFCVEVDYSAVLELERNILDDLAVIA